MAVYFVTRQVCKLNIKSFAFDKCIPNRCPSILDNFNRYSISYDTGWTDNKCPRKCLTGLGKAGTASLHVHRCLPLRYFGIKRTSAYTILLSSCMHACMHGMAHGSEFLFIFKLKPAVNTTILSSIICGLTIRRWLIGRKMHEINEIGIWEIDP